jgi:hypothetical protein
MKDAKKKVEMVGHGGIRAAASQGENFGKKGLTKNLRYDTIILWQ